MFYNFIGIQEENRKFIVILKTNIYKIWHDILFSSIQATLVVQFQAVSFTVYIWRKKNSYYVIGFFNCFYCFPDSIAGGGGGGSGGSAHVVINNPTNKYFLSNSTTTNNNNNTRNTIYTFHFFFRKYNENEYQKILIDHFIFSLYSANTINENWFFEL